MKTMSMIVPIRERGSQRLLVEATIADSHSALGIAPESIVDTALDCVSEAIDAITAAVHNGLEHVAPTKVSATFGIQLSVESGKLTALLVKGTATANLSITLEWAPGTITGSTNS